MLRTRINDGLTYEKRWRLRHLELARERGRLGNKKYRNAHLEKSREYQREYRKNHIEKYRKYYREYGRSHLDKHCKTIKKYNRNHPDKVKERNRVSYAKRKGLGFEILWQPKNITFPIQYHHIDRILVVGIPTELHRSIYHNVLTGKNMDKINKLAFAYISNYTEVI